MPEHCRICNESTRTLFRSNLLSYDVDYFECDNCGYVQTQQPFWLEEAYSNTINLTDTGIVRRNQRNNLLVIRMMSMLGCLHGRVVDLAGGYGLLVRMLRDSGVQAFWHDPYCENLVARGFEAATVERVDLVTGFEVLEHLEKPLEFFDSAFSRSDHVLLSTQLIPTPTPQPRTWWYFGSEHGQHIGFFRPKTLRYVANRFGWQVHTDRRSTHLFTRNRIPQWQWWLARNTKKLAPLIAKSRLRSLMWDDHHALERRSVA